MAATVTRVALRESRTGRVRAAPCQRSGGIRSAYSGTAARCAPRIRSGRVSRSGQFDQGLGRRDTSRAWFLPDAAATVEDNGAMTDSPGADERRAMRTDPVGKEMPTRR